MYKEEESFPLVSIIVLNYNNLSDLPICLNSLLNLNYPTNRIEIILADNSSSDNSVEFVEASYPNIKIARFSQNYGFAKGNNLAVLHACGDFIAFVNPDTRLDKNWLKELVYVLDSNNLVASCGGKVLFFDDEHLVQVAGTKLCPHGSGYNMGYGDTDGEKYSDVKYSLSSPGCSMLVRKDIFLKASGFDPDYFMYVEEFDLGYRLWLLGYKVLYIPTALSYHKMPQQNKFKITPQMVYFEERNRLATILKNYEFKLAVNGFLVSFCYALYRTIKYLFQGRFNLIYSIIKGWIDFKISIKRILEKRKAIQSNKVVFHKQLVKYGIVASLSECLQELSRTTKFR